VVRFFLLLSVLNLLGCGTPSQNVAGGGLDEDDSLLPGGRDNEVKVGGFDDELDLSLDQLPGKDPEQPTLQPVSPDPTKPPVLDPPPLDPSSDPGDPPDPSTDGSDPDDPSSDPGDPPDPSTDGPDPGDPSSDPGDVSDDVPPPTHDRAFSALWHRTIDQGKPLGTLEVLVGTILHTYDYATASWLAPVDLLAPGQWAQLNGPFENEALPIDAAYLLNTRQPPVLEVISWHTRFRFFLLATPRQWREPYDLTSEDSLWTKPRGPFAEGACPRVDASWNRADGTINHQLVLCDTVLYRYDYTASTWLTPIDWSIWAAGEYAPSSSGTAPLEYAWHHHTTAEDLTYVLAGNRLYRLHHPTSTWLPPLSTDTGSWADTGAPYETAATPLDAVWAEATGTVRALRGSVLHVLNTDGTWEASEDLSAGAWHDPRAPFESTLEPVDAAARCAGDSGDQLWVLRGTTLYRRELPTGTWATVENLSTGSWAETNAPFAGTADPIDALWCDAGGQSGAIGVLRGTVFFSKPSVAVAWTPPVQVTSTWFAEQGGPFDLVLTAVEAGWRQEGPGGPVLTFLRSGMLYTFDETTAAWMAPQNVEVPFFASPSAPLR